ncbi:unnamed protein product [Cuscuta campestris]|uniref:DUF7769 domain-containing protein n=1 Tax=Cuscuta campestris TaxID=132261 RepID=A0A484MFG5_9ASTE|nr:unnamed protein product [Cuscuta campestris]
MDYISSNPSSSTLHVFDLNLPPAAHEFDLNEDPTPASRGDDPSFDADVPTLSIRATASFSDMGRLAEVVSPRTPRTNTSTSRGVHTGQPEEPVHENEEEQQENNTTHRLSDTQKKRIVEMLMGKAKEDCKLQRGVIKEVAAKFNTNRWAVHTLWTKAKQQFNAGLPINVAPQMRGRVGKKRVTCDLGKLVEVHFHKRKNIRAVAYQLNVSKSTVHRLLKEKQIRRHTNAIKPSLTDSGKEGAKRSSKNRPAGTLETKPIPIVNRDVMKQMMLNQVIPAFKAKWPKTRAKIVIIQQDNAKPHVHPDDPDRVLSCQKDGWNISIKCQPPNSPDLNVLDLGFFASIDSLKNQKAPRNINELINAVQSAFEELTPQKLNKVFLTLQCVMEQILAQKGGNN